MFDTEELLKQVRDLHNSMLKIKQGNSLVDLEVQIESQILDIILTNYQEVLMRKVFAETDTQEQVS